MSKRTLGPTAAQRVSRFTVTLGTLLLFAQPALSFAARSAEIGAMTARRSAPSSTRVHTGVKSRIPMVTIIGIRERQALRRKVSKYVSATLVRHWNEPMARWDVPVCPLVAGLRKRPGNFVLERISQAAQSAHVALAGRRCRPNLFVVVTDHPDLLLKKLRARNRWMYQRDNTSQNLYSCLKSTRPIRVWYNITRSCGQGAPVDHLGGVSAPGGGAPPVCTHYGRDMLVNFLTSRSITSVYVIVDGRQVRNVSLEQMADYIALASLVRIRLDGVASSAPSILSLFDHGTAPTGLTPWDSAPLYAVYHIDGSLMLQRQQIEHVMFRRMLRRLRRMH